MIEKQKNNTDLIGKKVKTLVAKGGYDKGLRGVIMQVGIGNPDYFYLEETGGTSSGVYYRNKELVLSPETKEELKSDIKKLKSEISEIEKKIKVIEELGLDSYDDEYIKVYSALAIIEGATSKAEKAKAITALLKK